MEGSACRPVDREIGTPPAPGHASCHRRRRSHRYSSSLHAPWRGTGTLTYSLTPAIPGLTFDGNVRTLTGRPTEVGEYDMTFRAMDKDDNTATLEFTITVDTATVVRTLVSAVAAGDAGRLRFMDLPEPAADRPSRWRAIPSSPSGGSFFLNLATDGAADTLLVSIGGESFGYYQIDLDDAAATAHRLTGQLPFDLDPALGPLPAGDGGGRSTT